VDSYFRRYFHGTLRENQSEKKPCSL
jgi:hypothetical protein